jgi:hypothetical protein
MKANQYLHAGSRQTGRACWSNDSGHGAGDEVNDVRYSAWCLAASLLVCVSTSQAQVGGTDAQNRPALPNLAAADWKKNLASGPNGPIPAIVVDQFGYLPKSRKVAVIRTPQVG